MENNRLFIFNNDGSLKEQKPFKSIIKAITAGYKSGRDFAVLENQAEYDKGIYKIYYTGRRSDLSRSDYKDWPFYAKQNIKMTYGIDIKD